MRTISEATHAAAGVTAAQRAVLERLSRGGAQTVPAIARSRDVSRQHVQKVVDGLVATGLVMTRDNPAHKRSPALALTEAGRAAFAAIEAHERAIVTDLAARLGDRDLGSAARTVHALADALGAVAAGKA
jgi:DNA-binding MarR family transcriptional regulator